MTHLFIFCKRSATLYRKRQDFPDENSLWFVSLEWITWGSKSRNLSRNIGCLSPKDESSFGDILKLWMNTSAEKMASSIIDMWIWNQSSISSALILLSTKQFKDRYSSDSKLNISIERYLERIDLQRYFLLNLFQLYYFSQLVGFICFKQSPEERKTWSRMRA